jgi:hypothetical protein
VVALAVALSAPEYPSPVIVTAPPPAPDSVPLLDSEIAELSVPAAAYAGFSDVPLERIVFPLESLIVIAFIVAFPLASTVKFPLALLIVPETFSVPVLVVMADKFPTFRLLR